MNTAFPPHFYYTNRKKKHAHKHRHGSQHMRMRIKKNGVKRKAFSFDRSQQKYTSSVFWRLCVFVLRVVVVIICLLILCVATLNGSSLYPGFWIYSDTDKTQCIGTPRPPYYFCSHIFLTEPAPMPKKGENEQKTKKKPHRMDAEDLLFIHDIQQWHVNGKHIIIVVHSY